MIVSFIMQFFLYKSQLQVYISQNSWVGAKVEVLGGGRTPGRRQWRVDQDKPGGTQATAKMTALSGADGGKSLRVGMASDSPVTMEVSELGAEVEPLGLQAMAEVESRPRKLKAEVRGSPTMVMLEEGRPAELVP